MAASNSNESLILEVEKYPQLYDVSLEAYKDAVKKQDIWESIGVRVDMPGTQACKKWKDIRDAFVKSRNKQKTKSGQAAKKAKPYKYEHILEFLLPYIRPRSTQSNITLNVESDDCDSDGHASDGDSVETQNESRSSTPVVRTVKKRKRHESPQIEEEILKYLHEGRDAPAMEEHEDEDEIFFRSMATMCKKLPSSLKSRVKFQIHKVLFEAEMEHGSQ